MSTTPLSSVDPSLASKTIQDTTTFNAINSIQHLYGPDGIHDIYSVDTGEISNTFDYSPIPLLDTPTDQIKISNDQLSEEIKAILQAPTEAIEDALQQLTVLLETAKATHALDAEDNVSIIEHSTELLKSNGSQVLDWLGENKAVILKSLGITIGVTVAIATVIASIVFAPEIADAVARGGEALAEGIALRTDAIIAAGESLSKSGASIVASGAQLSDAASIVGEALIVKGFELTSGIFSFIKSITPFLISITPILIGVESVTGIGQSTIKNLLERIGADSENAQAISSLIIATAIANASINTINTDPNNTLTSEQKIQQVRAELAKSLKTYGINQKISSETMQAVTTASFAFINSPQGLEIVDTIFDGQRSAKVDLESNLGLAALAYQA